MPRNPHTFAAAYALLIKDGNILLLRRYNTGYEDGNYSLPAGHVEPEETFTQSIIRETREETGITLREENLQVAHIMHRNNQHGRSYVDVFYTVREWAGTPENKEHEKCDDLAWFPLDNLPKNTIPSVLLAIENSQKGVFYSEFSW